MSFVRARMSFVRGGLEYLRWGDIMLSTEGKALYLINWKKGENKNVYQKTD